MAGRLRRAIRALLVLAVVGYVILVVVVHTTGKSQPKPAPATVLNFPSYTVPATTPVACMVSPDCLPGLGPDH